MHKYFVCGEWERLDAFRVGKDVFEAWNFIEFFNQVRVDPKSDTLAWGEDIDLGPYVLQEELSIKEDKQENAGAK